MLEKIDNISYSVRCQFDDIIDVRSPSEFAEDSIPGAINLPVLDDDERHEVGTIYCRQSRHEARRRGAAYVTKNISNYLNDYFASKSSSYQPLIYCWRGGMRSQSMATILNNVGWYTKTLAGGYKTWRQHVVSSLRQSELEHTFILIDGQTGANKTKILTKLQRLGCQTLDLENLANHRGSVFGSLQHTKQPTQKYFESLIYDNLSRLDPSKPVFVEAESPKIGRRALPTAVVNKMRRSSRIEIRAESIVRAENLVECYSDLISTPDKIFDALEYLRPYHAAGKIQRWQQYANDKRYVNLALELIENHYDPCYERQRAKRQDQAAGVINLSALDETTLDAAAKEITNLIPQLNSNIRDASNFVRQGILTAFE